MPTVTVPGANHSTVKLVFDNDANAVLAHYVAGVIQAGVTAGTILPADNKNGPPPPVPAGKTGELVISKAGTQLVPGGYDFVVDSATTASVFTNGDANQAILVGEGNLSLFAMGGAGSIIGGGGKDMISIAPTDAGSWLIALGNGDDFVRALGSGNNTINVGSGKDIIQLGAGSTFVTTTGSDTVMAGSGSETIDASSGGKQVIFGNTSNLFFVAGGAASVFGGSGSDTVFGGSGRELFEGGSAGGNFLQAGDGPATLFGGGSGDQLYAAGDKRQDLRAASGNETLSGVFASGKDTFQGGSGSDQIFGGSGSNTFVAGTGSATVTASPDAKNVFEFMKSAGGGKEEVTGLTAAAQVRIELLGYSSTEVKFALDHQKVTDGSVTVTLSDNTMVTFQNIGALSSSNFITGSASGAMAGQGGSDDHGGNHGHHGHDS